jgi:hypothetical protein
LDEVLGTHMPEQIVLEELGVGPLQKGLQLSGRISGVADKALGRRLDDVVADPPANGW